MSYYFDIFNRSNFIIHVNHRVAIRANRATVFYWVHFTN
jgi:hypothetical protein